MKIKGWLFNNFLSKLLSLLIATGLWFFVVFENMPEVTFIVPLQIKNQPRNMALVGNITGRDIEVRLRGPQAIMSGLTAYQVETTIDLSELGTGETLVPLTPDAISVPRRVKVMGISPSSVTVKLESIVSRLVKIEPVILGVPADGYLLKETRVFPEQVKVLGAKSILEKLKSFYTDSVDIGGANKPLTAKVRIIIQDKNIRLADSDLVEVRPIIVEKEIDKEFQAVSIIVIPPGMKAALNPDRVNVVLHGTKSKLAQIKPDDLIATINFLDLPEDKNWITPNISLPEGISLVKMIPEQVEISAVTQEEGDELLRPKPGRPIMPQKPTQNGSIQKTTEQEITFVIPLKIMNRSKKLALVENTAGQKIEIRLQGPQAIISGLSAKQMKATIDVSNYKQGETAIPLTPDIIPVPPKVKVLGISPSSVTVELEPVVSRLIKVEPVIMGVPAEGYLLKEIRVFPEHVKVFGAKSVLEKLKTFSTDSVDIEGAKKSLTAKVSLTLPDKNIQLADSDLVEIRPVIIEKDENREFLSIQIIVIPPGNKVTLNPDRIDVILHGPKSRLAQIKQEDLIATINFNDLPEGGKYAIPKLSLPEGISLLKISPDKVEVISPTLEKDNNKPESETKQKNE